MGHSGTFGTFGWAWVRFARARCVVDCGIWDGVVLCDCDCCSNRPLFGAVWGRCWDCRFGRWVCSARKRYGVVWGAVAGFGARWDGWPRRRRERKEDLEGWVGCVGAYWVSYGPEGGALPGPFLRTKNRNWGVFAGKTGFLFLLFGRRGLRGSGPGCAPGVGFSGLRFEGRNDEDRTFNIQHSTQHSRERRGGSLTFTPWIGRRSFGRSEGEDERQRAGGGD